MLRDSIRGRPDMTVIPIVHTSGRRRPTRLYFQYLPFMALAAALHVYLRLLATAQNCQ